MTTIEVNHRKVVLDDSSPETLAHDLIDNFAVFARMIGNAAGYRLHRVWIDVCDDGWRTQDGRRPATLKIDWSGAPLAHCRDDKIRRAEFSFSLPPRFVEVIEVPLASST